jgi:epoxyqueuosine reductase QueG
MGLLDVLGWDEAARQTAFIRSPMKRAKLDQMKRNALIVAGNVLRQREDAGLRGRIEAIANDDSEPILARETARQVLRSFKL